MRRGLLLLMFVHARNLWVVVWVVAGGRERWGSTWESGLSMMEGGRRAWVDGVGGQAGSLDFIRFLTDFLAICPLSMRNGDKKSN